MFAVDKTTDAACSDNYWCGEALSAEARQGLDDLGIQAEAIYENREEIASAMLDALVEYPERIAEMDPAALRSLVAVVGDSAIPAGTYAKITNVIDNVSDAAKVVNQVENVVDGIDNLPTGYTRLQSAGAAVNNTDLPDGFYRVSDDAGEIKIAGPDGEVYDNLEDIPYEVEYSTGLYDPKDVRADLESVYGEENVTSTTVPNNALQTVNSNPEKGIEVVVDSNGGKAVKVEYLDQTTGETSVANIPYNSRDLPIFDDVAAYTTTIDHSVSYTTQMKYATENLSTSIKEGAVDALDFTADQLADIQAGKSKITGYTWHHNADTNSMQLVPTEIHSAVKHIGQASLSEGK